MRGRVALHIAVMHLHYAGKEHSEQGDEQSCKSKNVLKGEVSHKWQTCSTSNHTIVKYLLSQLWCDL
jgi:hypothetical protein